MSVGLVVLQYLYGLSSCLTFLRISVTYAVRDRGDLVDRCLSRAGRVCLFTLIFVEFSYSNCV